MKIRENIVLDDDYSDLHKLSDGNYINRVCEDNIRIPCNNTGKQVAFLVMTISLSLVSLGVHQVRNRPVSVENAIVIEDSHWSEIADASRIESYFTSLSYGSQYDFLDAMSSSGESSVNKAVKDCLNASDHLYDESYGRAYIMQKFGSFISLNEVIGKQGYKIKVSINYTSDEDIRNFFFNNSDFVCRFFTNHEVSQENIVREILNLLDSYEIDTSELILELPVEESDGVLAIADDSQLLDLLNNSYNQSVNELITQIKLHR